MEKDDKNMNESKPESSNEGTQENKDDEPNAPDSEVDQEMADAYGFTPQQAKEARLYLQLELGILGFALSILNDALQSVHQA